MDKRSASHPNPRFLLLPSRPAAAVPASRRNLATLRLTNAQPIPERRVQDRMPNFRTLENLAAENDNGPVPPPLPSQYPAEDGGPARRLAHVAEKFNKFW